MPADDASIPGPPRSQATRHATATQSNTRTRLENASAPAGMGPMRAIGAAGTQLLRPRRGSATARGQPSGHREIFHARLNHRWRNDHWWSTHHLF